MTVALAENPHPQPEIDDDLAPAPVQADGSIDWTHPQLAAPFDTIDLFAAGGGWDEGSRAVAGLDHDAILGIEWEEWACRTAIAAGHRRLMADLALLNPRHFARGRAIIGLIASPPCQGFSMAGDGAGRRDTDLILAAVGEVQHKGRPVDEVILDLRDKVEDIEKSALVLEPLRWTLDLRPEWTCWEQVPAVLPLWQACSKALRAHGYHVWTGVLNSADYGVPQTRRRAILIASRVRHVSRPEPTHAKGGSEGDLFTGPLPPWISMAQALGWGMTERPYPVVASSRDTGGPDREKVGGSAARASIYAEKDAGRWVPDPLGELKDELGTDHDDVVRVQRSNYSHGDAPTAEERGRGVRLMDEPSFPLTGRPPQWLDIDADTDLDDPTVQRALARGVELVPGIEGRNLAIRGGDEPAPTIAFGKNASNWRWQTRPKVMLAGGVAGDAVPRSVDEPSPTLGGKGTAVWAESEDAWIRGERLASGETPKGARMLEAGGNPDRRFPDRPVEPGELTVELRRGGDRIEEGFDPAAEPCATITTRVDRWQIKPDPRASSPLADHPAPTIVTTRRSKDGIVVGRRLPEGESEAIGGWGWDAAETFCLFCRCSDDHHDADGACSSCSAGLVGGTLPHCTWEAWNDPTQWPEAPDYTPGDQTGANRPPASSPDLATLKVWGDRPATTVVATRHADVVSGPGYRGPGDPPRQEAAGGVRVTVAEAAILQSFPAAYPWQGTKTRQYQAVGNAVPPRLAAHVLATACGAPTPEYP